MRLLLAGAFPYPHHQGSQVYFQEQAIALRAAGAEVDLITYATSPGAQVRDLDDWRALDGFAHAKPPMWTAPRSLRAGPNWRKPLADAGLFMTLRDAIASKLLQSKPYDAILTHNVEAALVGLGAVMTRPEPRPAVVYCVHTLMENELSSYPKFLKEKRKAESEIESDARGSRLRMTARRVINRFGSSLDRGLARRADGWIALTHSSQRVMRRASVAPGALIPPPIPDPRLRLETLDAAGVARHHALPQNGFYLYSGNLDGYQEIDLLLAAAAGRSRDRAPIVVASHDPALLGVREFADTGIETRWVRSGEEMLALIHAARATLVMRQAEGGFPIKLANSLAAGTPPICFLEREWGLADGENAVIASGPQPERALRSAIARLDGDGAEARRLGVNARALYDENHRPEAAAARTLQLIEQVIRERA